MSERVGVMDNHYLSGDGFCGVDPFGETCSPRIQQSRVHGIVGSKFPDWRVG